MALSILSLILELSFIADSYDRKIRQQKDVKEGKTEKILDFVSPALGFWTAVVCIMAGIIATRQIKDVRYLAQSYQSLTNRSFVSGRLWLSASLVLSDVEIRSWWNFDRLCLQNLLLPSRSSRRKQLRLHRHANCMFTHVSSCFCACSSQSPKKVWGSIYEAVYDYAAETSAADLGAYWNGSDGLKLGWLSMLWQKSVRLNFEPILEF